ncbi:YnhF family membrane protein [Serratia microhaemolytica]|nr:YnhF family membrane protein [Serratia microhaemolytica]
MDTDLKLSLLTATTALTMIVVLGLIAALN